jgi:hypothetical protein
MAALAQAADPGAAADEGEIYGRDGFYVGASLAGVAFLGFGDSAARQVSNTTGDAAEAKTETTAGANLRIGYRMHPRVAAEAQWEWLAPSDIALKLSDSNTGEFLTEDSALEVQSWIVTANLKGYILTKGDLQPYLLLGAGIISGEVDGKTIKDEAGSVVHDFSALSGDSFSFVGRMGGGLDYYFTPHLVGVIDLTYVLPTGNLKDFAYISGGLGLQYRF